jgi:cyclopropane-fatty-acyl-phospholipid synthase
MPSNTPVTSTAAKLKSLLENLLQTPIPVRLRAWDGSTAGPDDTPVLVIRHKRA